MATDWKAKRAERKTKRLATTKDYAPSTQLSMDREKRLWDRFCKDELQCDPEETMKEMDAEDIATYLDWKATVTKVQCISSLKTAYKNLQSLYRDKMGGLQVRSDINTAVHLHMKKEMAGTFGLKTRGGDKAVVTSSDFVNILEGLWKWKNYRPDLRLIQCSFMAKIMAYTATRPGAIMETSTYKNEALFYKDVKLYLVRYPSGQCKFALEINLTKLKGKRDEVALGFALFEMDNTVLCPLFDFITLACARQAFEIADMNAPGNLFDLWVTGTTPYMEISFKPELLNTPICCGSDGNPMTYAAISGMLKNGGLHAGFARSVTCYWLRRGASNAISRVATPAELTQIMGHTTPQIFAGYYADRNIRIDTQAAFFGTAPQSEILEALRRLERDPMAPCKLDRDQIEKIWASDELLEGLIKDRGRAENGSEASRELDLLIKSRKEKLINNGTIQLRAEWFKTRSSREIQQQLAGEEPPLHVEERVYLSDWHKSLVESIFGRPNPNHRRPDIIRDLIQFCLPSTALEDLGQDSKPDLQTTPTACLSDANEPKLELIWEDSTVYKQIPKSLACPFCSTKASTRSNLKRHVVSKHLPRTTSTPIQCPCGVQCSKIGIFKNHFVLHHGIPLSLGDCLQQG